MARAGGTFFQGDSCSVLSRGGATYDSPAGLIRSYWKKENDKWELEVTVPPNGKATIYFPNEGGRIITEASGRAKVAGEKEGYALFEVGAGNYRFSD